MPQLIRKAAAVLHAVASEGSPTFTRVQEQTGLNKSTLSRILGELEQLGFLVRSEGRAYSVGPALLDIARPSLLRNAQYAVAEKYARLLAEELGEVVTVGVLRGGRRYNAAKATVNREVAVDAHLDLRPSPFDTATGRALLAWAGKEDVEEALRVNGPPGEHWPGVDTPDALMEALAEIRRLGRAEKTQKGAEVESFAVPVLDAEGRAAMSIGFAAPRYRLTPERREKMLEVLSRTAEAMAGELALKSPRHG